MVSGQEDIKENVKFITPIDCQLLFLVMLG
jgi:hypothetical protein